MTSSVRVAYYQVTLGPAHFARIHALDRLPGIECRGVALAYAEATRSFVPGERAGAVEFDQVIPGTYEKQSLFRRTQLVLRHLRVTRPQVIIIDAPADPVQLILGRVAQRHGILVLTRWAATVLDHPRRAWKEALKAFVYRKWDGYLVTGSRGLDYLKTFGVAEAAVRICGNPADVKSIAEILDRSQAVDREPVFLFVGRFLPLKNLPRFVRAYLRYRDQGGSYRLRLVGFGDDEETIRALGVGRDDIELVGHLSLDELVPQYRSCAALVLPSYSENWGLVINEAMQAGLPVLASSHLGCIPELVDAGRSAIVFDPMSEASMADALRRFEEMSAVDRAALVREAHERVNIQTPENWARCCAELVLGAPPVWNESGGSTG